MTSFTCTDVFVTRYSGLLYWTTLYGRYLSCILLTVLILTSSSANACLSLLRVCLSASSLFLSTVNWSSDVVSSAACLSTVARRSSTNLNCSTKDSVTEYNSLSRSLVRRLKHNQQLILLFAHVHNAVYCAITGCKTLDTVNVCPRPARDSRGANRLYFSHFWLFLVQLSSKFLSPFILIVSQLLTTTSFRFALRSSTVI